MTAALTRRAALAGLGAGLAGIQNGLAVAASAPAAAAVQLDPIFPAIETLRTAEAALSAALRDLDEDDAEQLRAADEAADRSGDARNALSAVMPTTPAGFRALVQFHAADVMWLEPDTYGALALRDIAAAMEALLQARARASPLAP